MSVDFPIFIIAIFLVAFARLGAIEDRLREILKELQKPKGVP